MLSLASKRILGIDFPRGRDLGPVVVVWLLSVSVLVLQRDLGMSLLYLGMFVAALYIATERVSWLIIGGLLFSGGAVLAYLLGHAIGGPFTNFANRVDIWRDPFADPYDLGWQPVQGLLGLATGGLFGTGPGGGQPRMIPRSTTTTSSPGWVRRSACSALGAAHAVPADRDPGHPGRLAVRDSFGKLLAGEAERSRWAYRSS